MGDIFNLELDVADQADDESEDDSIETDELEYNIPRTSAVCDLETDVYHELMNANTECEVSSRKIGQKDFECLSTIGGGSFGKVYQVKKISGNDEGTFFAMKVLKKDEILKNKKHMEHTKAERNILEAIKHPFIVDLYYAFQTKRKLYLILEFLNGGDLFYYLAEETILLDDSACFYSGEIILALQHLHKEGIIYRDLKPENVLLDAEGHVKLTDFGLSKENIDDGSITRTFCGTIEYMAPEIIQRKGHSKAVDWWSLGAVIYYMLVGQAPFSGKNRKKTMQKIISQKFYCPKHVSEDAKNLMQRLLKKPVRKRIGSGPDDAEPIKNHQFFRNVNWDDLLAKKVVPPFEPKLTGKGDISRFDSGFTEKVVDDSSDSSDVSTESNPFQGFTLKPPYSSDEFLRNDSLSPEKCSYDLRGP